MDWLGSRANRGSGGSIRRHGRGGKRLARVGRRGRDGRSGLGDGLGYGDACQQRQRRVVRVLVSGFFAGRREGGARCGVFRAGGELAIEDASQECGEHPFGQRGGHCGSPFSRGGFGEDGQERVGRRLNGESHYICILKTSW